METGQGNEYWWPVRCGGATALVPTRMHLTKQWSGYGSSGFANIEHIKARYFLGVQHRLKKLMSGLVMDTGHDPEHRNIREEVAVSIKKNKENLIPDALLGQTTRNFRFQAIEIFGILRDCLSNDPSNIFIKVRRRHNLTTGSFTITTLNSNSTATTNCALHNCMPCVALGLENAFI